MSPPPPVGVLLAAGASRRMGSCKALARFGGETLLARALRTLRDGGCPSIVVVVAAPHEEAIRDALGRGPSPLASLAHNDAPALGMLRSLKVGLRAAAGFDAGAAVVALLDHPRVRADTVAALLEAWRDDGARVARPRYGRRHGHPYLIDRALFEAVFTADESRSVKPVLVGAEGSRSVPVDDPGVLDDVDTLDVLDALRRA